MTEASAGNESSCLDCDSCGHLLAQGIHAWGCNKKTREVMEMEGRPGGSRRTVREGPWVMLDTPADWAEKETANLRASTACGQQNQKLGLLVSIMKQLNT